MSTLRTTHIQHPSSPAPNITLNADGTTELPGVSSSLAGLTDVDVSQVGDGDVLAYSSSNEEWGPVQLSFDLSDLSNVEADSPSTGDTIVYDDNGPNGASWYKKTLTTGDLSDVNASPSDGQSLVWNNSSSSWVAESVAPNYDVKVDSSDVDEIDVLTQAAYNGITPNARTLYIIVG